jgi:hypothetical protein
MITNWNEGVIRRLLATNNVAVEKAILAIYQRQTSDEQRTAHTRHLNHCGFTAGDAHWGSRYAQWLQANPDRHLGGQHLDRARLMSMRYVRQLLEVAQARTQ